MHVEDDYDYYFSNKDNILRDELFDNLKASYFMARNTNLPIYKVNVPLKTDYNEKKDLKKDVQKMHTHDYNLESENYFDPFSNNKNTVDSGFASSVI